MRVFRVAVDSDFIASGKGTYQRDFILQYRLVDSRQNQVMKRNRTIESDRNSASLRTRCIHTLEHCIAIHMDMYTVPDAAIKVLPGESGRAVYDACTSWLASS